MRTRIFCLSLLASVASVATAHAQNIESTFQRDKNVSVTQRPRPGYEALGIHAGAFYIYPKVTADVATEDNIFFQNTNERSDTVYSIRPQIEAVSQWSRHRLRLVAQSNTYKYDKFSSEDNTTYGVSGDGRIDIQRNFYMNLGAGYQHLVEARYSPSVQQLASDPIEYDRTYGNFGISREVNRLRVSGELRYDDYQYDNTSFNGAPVDQSYRDHQVTTGDVRVDYAISPALAVYVFGSMNDRSYDNRLVNPLDVIRDSKGWETAIGADFEVTDLVRGQVQAGYLTQEYDDPRVSDSTGLALRSRLEWFPTRLTTVTLTAERSVEDTGLIGAVSSLSTRASAQVDYELLRNLILTGRVNWARDEYSGLDRDDNYSMFMFGANYLITRHVGVFGQFNFQSRDSKGTAAGIEFDANRFQLGVVLQY